MAMNTENKTNEVANTQAQEQNVQAPAENQQPAVQAPEEKKPSRGKTWVKKALIVAGGAAALGLSFFGGFETGKHSASKDGSNQDQTAGSDSQAE